MIKIVPAQIPVFAPNFSGQFSKYNSIVKGYFYDVRDKLLFMVISATNQFNIFVFVPQPFAWQLNNTDNADKLYDQGINVDRPSPANFHPVLLTEGCGGLLLEQGGYLLAR